MPKRIFRFNFGCNFDFLEDPLQSFFLMLVILLIYPTMVADYCIEGISEERLQTNCAGYNLVYILQINLIRKCLYGVAQTLMLLNTKK